jgi:2-dehydro-3-deoxygalactonokinase
MLIAVDWGTSRLRAYLLDADGTVRERRGSDAGIAMLGGSGFDVALAPLLDGWPRDAPLLMCGMIGSRQGIVEVPYLPCPADPAGLARALAPVAIAGRDGRIVPGLSCDPPDVMRGEETLILGSGVRDGLVCLPGSHSKWVRVAGGVVQGFRTYLTGELFAAVAGHTIVGRLLEPVDPPDWRDWFGRGVMAARGPGAALTHQLFGLRAAGLLGRMPPPALRPHLSGLLVGHEIAAEAPAAQVTLIGEGPLLDRYESALDSLAVPHRAAGPDAGPAGLFMIARNAGMLG